ncbi:hypothetical protein LCGC14_1380770, partial [marine sediment metagenome]
MTNEERDNMLIEMHGNIKVIVGKVDEHHKTLYGNAKPGVVSDVTLLQERQDNCPARQVAGKDDRRLNIARIALILLA